MLPIACVSYQTQWLIYRYREQAPSHSFSVSLKIFYGKKKRRTDQVHRKNAVKAQQQRFDKSAQSSSARASAVTSCIRAQAPSLIHSGSIIQLPPTHITFFNAM